MCVLDVLHLHKVTNGIYETLLKLNRTSYIYNIDTGCPIQDILYLQYIGTSQQIDAATFQGRRDFEEIRCILLARTSYIEISSSKHPIQQLLTIRLHAILHIVHHNVHVQPINNTAHFLGIRKLHNHKLIFIKEFKLCINCRNLQ